MRLQHRCCVGLEGVVLVRSLHAIRKWCFCSKLRRKKYTDCHLGSLSLWLIFFSLRCCLDFSMLTMEIIHQSAPMGLPWKQTQVCEDLCLWQIQRIIIRRYCPNRLTRWCLGWQKESRAPVTHAGLLQGYAGRSLVHLAPFRHTASFAEQPNSSSDPLARMHLPTFKLGSPPVWPHLSPALKCRLVEWLGGRGPEGKRRDAISRRALVSLLRPRSRCFLLILVDWSNSLDET